MSRQLIIRPEAQTDLQEAFDWYEGKREGLGREFVLSVRRALENIQDHPLANQVIHESVRRKLIERFPYGVFYLVEDDSIVVIAVFHARRDPGIWQKRV